MNYFSVVLAPIGGTLCNKLKLHFTNPVTQIWLSGYIAPNHQPASMKISNQSIYDIYIMFCIK